MIDLVFHLFLRKQVNFKALLKKPVSEEFGLTQVCKKIWCTTKTGSINRIILHVYRMHLCPFMRSGEAGGHQNVGFSLASHTTTNSGAFTRVIFGVVVGVWGLLMVCLWVHQRDTTTGTGILLKGDEEMKLENQPRPTRSSVTSQR